ncbi:arp2/3 complex subunit [Malassezia equina]|uniref:Actin-related protein 2/3 complex subunit 5 n=1 Tax=Malassezia equina TaxID=1381935 RepID=A0AAF0IYW8_9BASI|nr:arp2/3 complex subunit [Malassezia equina]
MSDFRHLNVDQYDEEALHPLELAPPDPRSAQELLQLAQAKQAGVRTRLASHDIAGALTEALNDPPTGDHAMEARRATLSLVLDILNSTRTADIAPALKALRMEERDTLMKYLYRGLEAGRTGHSGVNCAVLLSWHEKVRGRKLTQLTQLAGTGCIVRVMTDRRVV